MCPVRCGTGSRRPGAWPVFLCLTLIVLAFSCGPAGPSRDSPLPADYSSADRSGVVYGYGKKLERPYTFTESEDGKTLYLNGLVYEGPGESPPPEIEVTETVRLQHELSVMASEQSKQARTYDERKAIYADILRQSPLVENVRDFEQGVYVTWRSSPGDEEEVIIPREESQFDLAAYRRQLTSEFWNTVNSGGVIAFGKRYHIHVPAGRVAKTMEQIQLIRSGASRDRLDVRGTALQNQRFLDDLYREGTQLDE
jgi:hypothetical protein